jgi:hypothetical protein
MDPFRRALIVEALLWLALARLALVILPFRHVARRLGDPVPPGSGVGDVLTTSSRSGDAALARNIGWAVSRTASAVPFRAVCLQQAIAAKMMLRRHGVQSALHFGVSTGKADATTLKAHAWLDAAGARITGYPIAQCFTEIACFV